MPRSVAAVVALLALLPGLSACNRGPPTPAEFRVDGLYNEVNFGSAQFRDGYAWRHAQSTASYIVLSDRLLPQFPESHKYPVIDLALLQSWARLPLVELELEDKGKLAAISTVSPKGGSKARCAQNPGQCYSAIEYVAADALRASYGFGNALDVSLTLPVHALSQWQPPLSAEQRTPPDRHGAGQATSDADLMAQRYQQVRTALSQGSVDAFLQANAYDAPTRNLLQDFAGLTEGIIELSIRCPPADGFEAFGNDGGFASLLVQHGENTTVAYFLLRGDTWLLHSCGGN